MTEKIQPTLFIYPCKNDISELCKFHSIYDDRLVFISIKTASLNDLTFREVTALDHNGNLVIHAKYNELADELINQASNNKISEGDIIGLLKNKTIISYNADFIYEAFRHNFKKSSSYILLLQLENNKISLMKSIVELLRKDKFLKLKNACELFDLGYIENGTSLHDSIAIFYLYNKILPFSKVADTWMAGFKDININFLYSLKNQTQLCYWESRDKERQLLFTPSSALGSERVAELDENLKISLSDIGYANFTLVYNDSLPDIKIDILTKEDAQHNHKIDTGTYLKNRDIKILNPKPLQKNKLRLSLNLDVFEANKKRQPKLNEIDLYRHHLKTGDVLKIEPFVYDNSFNIRKINFIDSSGQSCGTLMNETDPWLRIFGLIIKGYSAEIFIVDIHKGVKVDVYLKK